MSPTQARLVAMGFRDLQGEPEDVGRVIASLLSDERAWINAQSIEVAGGYNI